MNHSTLSHKVVGTGAHESAPRIGVIGGGQLARMMQEAAIALGIRLDCLVEASDGSAGQVIVDSSVGAADDVEAVTEIAHRCDVMTVEHEHVPDELLTALEIYCPVYPSAQSLQYAQDKLLMRKKMDEISMPNPRFFHVKSLEDVEDALQELGGTGVAKTPRDGYDGKGVRIIESANDVHEWLEKAENGLLLEEKVPFVMEVSQLVARRPSGEIRSWPLVQSIQQDGVCFQTIAPAPVDNVLIDQARFIGEKIAHELEVVGVLAVEMFCVEDDEGDTSFIINELAMRPHNTGHWTIDGARTSQFEQHLRAVLDLPLGQTDMNCDVSVMVNVLGSELEDPRQVYSHVMKLCPEAKIHMYGKAVKPGRKLGHVTVCSDSVEHAHTLAQQAASILRGETKEG
ncbi:MAG: 5-(carboxyamino)imidazole ribonucleotide synthase [Actinomycetaceae bacterium]|nr:5-(carboxyamino)imidazole ribonucleotide synthase [Actinomycetaceae bacterium]